MLVGILGNASLALSRLGPDSPARADLERIETAAERASELTRQMLAYSGRARFRIEPLDLSVLVHELAELLHASIPKQTTIAFDLAPDLPAVEGDAAQLRQVVMDLITNAADATAPGGGAVVLKTAAQDIERPTVDETGAETPRGSYVMIEVRDTGCGMDEDTRRRMFDPFFSTKERGHGLGLAATLGIVRAHRGSIRVFSEPGRGTSIRVLFPALAGPVTRDPAEAGPEGRDAAPERGQRVADLRQGGIRAFAY